MVQATNQIGKWNVLACTACMVIFSAAAGGNPLDTTADAALGQPDLMTNDPNSPDGLPTAANLSLSNAAGVAVAPNGRIYASDAENHRVLSWPSASAFTTGQNADLVLGQPDFESNAPNAGGISASSFFLPQGLWVDENSNLWVTDAFNCRVLMFADPATADGIADLVIGQPDFESGDLNLGQGQDGPDVALQDSLLFPGRVLVREQDVYLADSGNSRVLHYTLPFNNKPFADRVFGQFGDFTRRAKNNDGLGDNGTTPCPENLLNPIGIALDRHGRLYVADWGNHRVLRFDDPLGTDPVAATTADAVFGQPGFGTNSVDNGGLSTGMELPIDISFEFGSHLYVADSGNNRVLVYDDPLSNQTTASYVFGQLGSFAAEADNHGLGIFATDADALFGPTGMAHDSLHNLYVMDTNNSRLLRFDLPIAAPKPGDVNRDGAVDLADFATFVLCFGMGVDDPGGACTTALADASDLSGDGGVDLQDVLTFVANFGQ